MIDSNFAPVVLFVFSRPDHTKITIEALAANEGAESTDLIVYSDAARRIDDVPRVEAVREFLRGVRGFKSVKVVERIENFGLARNIMDGVTDVCRNYGRVIVLEDDIVTSQYFLKFMNSALERYRSEKKVWHISGWNYPISSEGLGDCYFVQVMNCWGWATWSDRWASFEKNAESLMSLFDRKMIRDFDLGNSGVFWSQVLNNQRGLINTWAVFWYAIIYLNKGVCLNPSISYVDNIGFDGTGVHGKASDIVHSVHRLSDVSMVSFPLTTAINSIGHNRIVAYYKEMKLTLLQRVGVKVKASLRRMRF